MEEVTFDKEITERLAEISMEALELIYGKVEKLDLTEREKVLAHCWIIRRYMEGADKAMKEIGISWLTIKNKV